MWARECVQAWGEVFASILKHGCGRTDVSVPSAWRALRAVINVKAFEGTPFTALEAGDTAAGLPGMSSSGAGRTGVVPRYGVEHSMMSFPFAGG
ncbi:PPE family protein, SVP subgroup [Mycobacterium leprae]|uniref:PPE family protein, SVP subgroup n=1 Tax=Mycobacterium leprae TaxID=1769 RepID=UPI001E284453|nr:hypothetical protein [Mycobacterium leprae]